MTSRVRFSFHLICICFALLTPGCTSTGDSEGASRANFSKADSLTETYLAMQDTVLQVWNTMIYDDNRKIRAMGDLLRELKEAAPENIDALNALESRLEDLVSMRYDQKSMSDPELVSEYDFASNSLVSELVALAEVHTEFTENTTIQRLVDSIRSADQRVMNYRAEYDDAAMRFNRFVDRNHHLLDDIRDSVPQKKPLFQMALE